MRGRSVVFALVILFWVQVGMAWGQGAPTPVEAPPEAVVPVPKPPPAVKPELTFFGSDFFQQAPSTFAPIPETPVPPTYSLGPGDVLIIRFWSPTMEQVEYKVDVKPEGTIFIPLAGELVMTGLTLEQARSQIWEELSRYYKNIRVVVTLDKVRSLVVFVAGNAVRPAGYTILGLSTAFNALYFAGGPNERGSMRRIELKRNNQTVGTLDLYRFLLTGDKSQDYPLENGDTVFIPVVGPLVGVRGEIKNPHLYELKGGERVSDLMEMAGGATASGYLARAQVDRVKDNQERVLLNVDVSAALAGDQDQNIELQDGDRVTLLPVVDLRMNDVSIAGNVLRPGEYELKPGMRVKDLILAAEGLAFRETFWQRAILFRTLPDASIELLAFDVLGALQGSETDNLELQRWDKVVIHSYDGLKKVTKESLQNMSELRDWQDVRTVCILGEVERPGIYQIAGEGNEKLSALLQQVGGVTEDAFVDGAVFLRDISQLVTEEHMKTASDVRERMESLAKRYYEAEVLRRLGLTPTAEQPAGLGSTPLGTATQALGTTAPAEERAIVAPPELPPVVSTGRIPIDLKRIIEAGGGEEDIVLRDGDTVIVPPRALTVLVTGAVASPSSIVHRQGKPVEYYVERAGGYTEDADVSRAVVIRAGGELAPVTRVTDVRPGDIVMVPPKFYVEPPKTRSQRLRETMRSAADVASTLYVLYLLTK